MGVDVNWKGRGLEADLLMDVLHRGLQATQALASWGV
jgi:hypothetical protein